MCGSLGGVLANIKYIAFDLNKIGWYGNGKHFAYRTKQGFINNRGGAGGESLAKKENGGCGRRSPPTKKIKVNNNTKQ